MTPKTSSLRLDDNFSGRADDVYEVLIRGHDGFSDEESAAMNARLVLLLANQIGDLEVIAEAVRIARDPTAAIGPAQDR